jgi:hypothetical protein
LPPILAVARCTYAASKAKTESRRQFLLPLFH